MATTLIDTRKSILSQIHTSWNEWRITDAAIKTMYGVEHISEHLMNIENKVKNLKSAEEFKKGAAPWTTTQSVLERNAVHANNLIRLYIALNIDVEKRWPLWQFFELASSGVVNWIKYNIQILKRVQNVLKLQQQLDKDLSNATDLYMNRGETSLDRIEKELKNEYKILKKNAEKIRRKEINKAKKAEKKYFKEMKNNYLKVAKKAAKVAAKKIAKAEKTEAKKIANIKKAKAKDAAKELKRLEKKAAKLQAQRKKWLEKIDAQNYGIQFDRENYSIEMLKKICRDIPSLKMADKKLAKLDAKEAKERAKMVKKLREVDDWCKKGGIRISDLMKIL